MPIMMIIPCTGRGGGREPVQMENGEIEIGRQMIDTQTNKIDRQMDGQADR